MSSLLGNLEWIASIAAENQQLARLNIPPGNPPQGSTDLSTNRRVNRRSVGTSAASVQRRGVDRGAFVQPVAIAS